MAEHVEGVRVVCEQHLDVQLEDRRAKYQWKFKVFSQVSPAQHSGRLRAAASTCCSAQSLSFGVFSLLFIYRFCEGQRNWDLGMSR